MQNLSEALSSLLFFCGSSAGPASVQYQPAAAALYQAQSGSPPSVGLPRVSLAANQQAASVRSPLPLAPGVPQQQQVVTCLSAWCLQVCSSSGCLTWVLLVAAGHYSGPGGGAGSRTPQTGQLPVSFGGSQGPREAAECRQCRVAQVTLTPPSFSIHPPLPSIVIIRRHSPSSPTSINQIIYNQPLLLLLFPLQFVSVM